MAQKLRDDKIGQLTHSAGNITMAASSSNPAYLTIGGQQYKITSNLIVALPALTANARYQVFAVLNAGVVELRISQNENSVGPTGFARWKLVGSLYANGLSPVAFGSFVNIAGVPTTNTIEFTTSITVPGGTNPTIGTTARNKSFYTRIGDMLFGHLEFRMSTVGTAGSGIYKFGFPGVLADSNKVYAVSGSAGQSIGSCIVYNPNVFQDAYTTVQVHEDYGGFVLTRDNTANRVGNLSFALNTANTEYGASYRVPIAGWSNTPIEDL